LYLYFKYFFGWVLVLVLKKLSKSILPITDCRIYTLNYSFTYTSVSMQTSATTENSPMGIDRRWDACFNSPKVFGLCVLYASQAIKARGSFFSTRVARVFAKEQLFIHPISAHHEHACFFEKKLCSVTTQSDSTETHRPISVFPTTSRDVGY